MSLAGLSSASVMSTYKRWPVRFVSGEGAHLFDADGRRYIDLLAGIAVVSIGHCHPALVAAVEDQIRKLIHVSNLFHTDPQEALARDLAEISGGYRSFFCNSGAEAIECALKLARRWARDAKGEDATGIVCAEGGFHGRTFGALSATGQPAKQAPFAPMVPGFEHVPYGDLAALESAMGPHVAAVLLEPIQGEAGVVVPPADYLASARALCDEHGSLLILDEIQTGLGRTGAWFGYAHVGIEPDILCLAKALAGGLPMGACLARPEVADAFRHGDHASTFGGGPVIAAAARATLGVIRDEGLIERSASLGARLASELEAVFAGAEVRGRGLMIGVVLPEESAHRVAELALERGVIVNDVAPNVVRITPPLVIEDDDIDEALSILREVSDEVGSS